jgi:hypothetical protein
MALFWRVRALRATSHTGQASADDPGANARIQHRAEDVEENQRHEKGSGSLLDDLRQSHVHHHLSGSIELPFQCADRVAVLQGINSGCDRSQS